MDKSQKENQAAQRRRFNPSFSSILLDAIYRSIDDNNGEREEQLILYRESTKRKQNTVITTRRNSTDFDRKPRNARDRGFPAPESCCTAGRFSSSEFQLPKPIKTVGVSDEKPAEKNTKNDTNPKNSMKAKSRASKMYQDLKKVKQPISPGGKLASFLNSLFNGGSPKTKQKISNSMDSDEDFPRKSKSAQGSTCSSTSSFSRSCLSKTPSSRGKVGKRTVRFEDSQKTQQKDEPDVVSAIKALKKASKSSGKFEKANNGDHPVFIKSYHLDNEEEEDDDAVSCSSSDLFELDNLSVIGIGRYQEELPVYETTHFGTNCAIANGMVL